MVHHSARQPPKARYCLRGAASRLATRLALRTIWDTERLALEVEPLLACLLVLLLGLALLFTPVGRTPGCAVSPW